MAIFHHQKQEKTMALLETAVKYIFNILTDNEDVKKFPKKIGATPKGEKAPPQYSSLKSELKALVVQNKTAMVFNRLLDYIEKQDEMTYNTVLLLFGQFNRLNDKENNGLVGYADANIERNRLNNALIVTIDNLEL